MPECLVYLFTAGFLIIARFILLFKRLVHPKIRFQSWITQSHVVPHTQDIHSSSEHKLRVRFPVKCSPPANATSLFPSFLKISIISERRLANLLVMQRSHRFNRNLKNKWLSRFLKKLIAKFRKKQYCTLHRNPALLTHFPYLFFSKVCLTV